MVQTGESKDLGLVSECDANNCTYNKDKQCTAGAIDVSFMDELAQCYTYTQEPVTTLQVTVGVGDVSQCDVIDCTYNVGQGCKAETIAVNFVDGVAQCATYTVSSQVNGAAM